MRPIWTGAIGFGLVNIPVKLYSATQSSNLNLDMLDKKDHSNIKYQRINEKTGKEVKWENIVKGYKLEGEYVVLGMLYLFRSFRILICSLVPNVIPLLVTAGIMGWTGVRLKPSTVLIFSVALGIAIDVTIRFLVNYKQELASHNFNIQKTVSDTIKHTGLSILYTSLVLIAGFVIFCFSGFGGTQSLGWLTSITLLTATLTNLILLPVLLLGTGKQRLKT